MLLICIQAVKVMFAVEHFQNIGSISMQLSREKRVGNVILG